MGILNCCKRLALGSVLLGSALAMGSCGNEYTYFTITMNFKDMMAPDLATIGTCALKIEAEGKEVDSFQLKQVDENGTKWGCATKETRTYIGKMNYSSLRAAGAVLKFTLTGKTDEGVNSKLVAEGSSEGTTSPGAVVGVEVNATKI
jgi:hypothetical protein